MINLIYKNSQIKVSEKGAELKSFECDNKEYIWYSDPKFWGRSAPFLFPVVGSTKGKKTKIKGKEYPLSQHGFLRDQEFKLVEKGENYCVLENTYSEETLKLYPFSYKAQIEYQLQEKSLETIIKITNLGEENMYFNIGGHPAFNCPIDENEKFEDYHIEFETIENISSPKVCEGGLLDFTCPVYVKDNIKEIALNKDIFKIDTILITNIKSKKVKLLNKNNQGIEFSYPGFTTLAIWTPQNEAPFICLEPWFGYNDKIDTDGNYESKADLIYLAPKGEFNISYKVKLVNR